MKSRVKSAPVTAVALCGALSGALAVTPARAQVVQIEGQPAGSLSGKRVVIDPGHGMAWTDAYGWQFARSEINRILEDMHVNEIVLDFLRSYLEGAGARVLSTRALSRQPVSVVVDNADPGYGETGTWTTTTNMGLGWKGSYRYAGVATDKATATARFSATLPARGDYPVWAFYYAGADRSTRAHFTIRHAGGLTRVTVNQQLDRQRWVYLGTYRFVPSQPAEVTLDNHDPTGSGAVVIADAVRFGMGMGDQVRNGKVSGYAHYAEDARYFMIDHGAPKEVYDTRPTERDSGLYSRPLYADWQGADAFVSIHTNASDMPNQGTGFECFVHSTAPTMGSAALQSAVHGELARTNKSLYAGAVKDRGFKSANFAVLRELKTMPAILCELAFFDTEKPDASLLRDDRYRRDLARAMYRGLARYFDPKAVIAPLTPTLQSAVNLGGGRVRLTWRPEADPLEPGAVAASYRVFIQRGDGGFGEPVTVTGTEHVVAGLSPGETVYFRVRAVNAGGESPPSSVLGARVVGSGDRAPIALVDGFQRIDEAITVRDGDNPGDWITAHGQSLAKSALPVAYFDGLHRSALSDPALDLSRYALVDLFLGAQSALFGNAKTLSSAEQDVLRRYLTGPARGHLLVSGSDLGGDLGLRGAQADRTFLRDVLSLDCTSESSAEPKLTGLLSYAGLGELRFSAAKRVAGAAAYPVVAPDVLTPLPPAQAMLTYPGGTAAAGVRVPVDAMRAEAGARIVALGFPLETVDAAQRDALTSALLSDLLCPTGIDSCPKPAAMPQPMPEGPQPAPDDVDPQATGCTAVPGARTPLLGLLLALPLLGLLLRRRRRAGTSTQAHG